MALQAFKTSYGSMDAVIRDACINDLDALVDLLQTLFSIEADFAVDASRQRRGIELMLDDCGEQRCIKVAEIDDKVAGMCSAQVLISTAEGGKVAMVEDMVVDAQYRGVGVGRDLMTAMEMWARERKLSRLQLLADRTNFSALDFYDKMGWCPTRLICLRRRWK